GVQQSKVVCGHRRQTFICCFSNESKVVVDPIKRFIVRAAGVASSSVAQAIQSLTSMVVLMLAAKLLGLEALGLFSILYGALILAAAITSGFVGDTLMV